APGGEGGEQRDARAGASRAQYGGSSDHQAPSALNAFQKRVLASCSSRDASISGGARASIVGVKVWISRGRATSTASESGKSRSSRNATVSEPIATTSFGWTMWSSRGSHRLASSGSSVPNFKQFVPS